MDRCHILTDDTLTLSQSIVWNDYFTPDIPTDSIQGNRVVVGSVVIHRMSRMHCTIPTHPGLSQMRRILCIQVTDEGRPERDLFPTASDLAQSLRQVPRQEMCSWYPIQIHRSQMKKYHDFFSSLIDVSVRDATLVALPYRPEVTDELRSLWPYVEKNHGRLRGLTGSALDQRSLLPEFESRRGHI